MFYSSVCSPVLVLAILVIKSYITVYVTDLSPGICPLASIINHFSRYYLAEWK